MNYQFIKNLTSHGLQTARKVAIAVGLASTVSCLTIGWPTLSLAESADDCTGAEYQFGQNKIADNLMALHIFTDDSSQLLKFSLG